MDIRLGMRVRSSDGQHVGNVDRIILEPDTREVFGIIAHKGHFFSEDRIIECGFIDSITDDAVRLRITGDNADDLPRFVEHEFVVPTPEELRTIPYPLDGGVSGAGATVLPVLWRSSYTGHDYRPASRPFFESAPVDAPAITMMSNLPNDAMVVDKGTDVIAADGTGIGSVEDVIFVDGALTGLVVRTGVFRHHDITIPVAMIDSVTPEQVRLNVSAEQVKASTDPRQQPVDTTAG